MIKNKLKLKLKLRPIINPNKPSGFTLLEVIITIGLLAVMIISITAFLRSSIDMRLALSEKSTVTSRLNIALGYIKKDLEQAYVLSVNLDKTFTPLGQTETFFQIKEFAGRTTLSLSSMNFDTNSTSENSSELSKVTYELKVSKKFPNRLALYRSLSNLYVEDPENSDPLVEGIRSLKLAAWNGSKWVNDWDSKKSAFNLSIPRMVRVTINAYASDDKKNDQDSAPSSGIIFQSTEVDEITHRSTIVYIPWAQRYKELKDKIKTVKW